MKSKSNYYMDPLTGDTSWSEFYLRDEESLVFGMTKYTEPSNSVYEKDDTPVEEYIYHGVTHYIFNSNTTAAWMVRNTEYYMRATDGVVDMKELIRSAYGTA